MKNWKVKLATSTVSFILDGRFQAIEKLVNKANAFYITDENVYALHQNKFKGKKTIVIPAGEEHKQQATVNFIIEALLNLGATREAVLIGVGVVWLPIWSAMLQVYICVGYLLVLYLLLFWPWWMLVLAVKMALMLAYIKIWLDSSSNRPFYYTILIF